MLRDVFAECLRVLEPGGRMAVNVANLGRKPYRSLSADVMRILQDDLGLLPRGEIIWRKAKGATGSIAVGSYLSAANPVLRDITERVIVVSKGRFDRAIPRKEREQSRAPVREHDHQGRVLPGHARRLGAASRARRAGSVIPRRSRSSSLRDSSSSTPTGAMSCSIRSSARAPRPSPRCAPTAATSGFDTDPEYVALAQRRIDDARSDGPPPA